MITTRLVFFASDESQAPTCLDIDEAGASIAKRLPLSSADEPAPARTILVIPGADTFTCWIELRPAQTSQRSLADAKAQLEDSVGTPIDSVHIALGSPEPDGLRLACIIDRAKMRSYIERATKHGIAPDIALPDYLLLGVPEGEGVTVSLFGPLLAARGRRLAFTAEPDLAKRILADRPIEMIEAQNDRSPMFSSAAAAPPLNLLQLEFAPKRKLGFKPSEFKRAAMLAATLVLSPLLIWTAQILRHELGTFLLDARAAQHARAVSVAGADDPALAVRGLLADFQSGDRFLSATATLFDGVAEIQGAELDSFSYRRDGDIRAVLIHQSPDDPAALGERLERYGYAFMEDGTEQRDTRLSTAFTLRPRS